MALSYFLKIHGVAGGSTADGQKGAFDIDGFSFDAGALMQAMSLGGGAGKGKTTFEPVTVELDMGSGMAALLKTIASGKEIPSIEIEGVSPDGKTVYDLKLGDVKVTTFHDSSTGKDMLTFTYDEVSLTTTPQADDGSLGKPETFTWNLATNTADVNIDDPVVPAGGAPAAAESFFLTIDGVAGESTDKDHKGAFEIDGYTFDVSALLSTAHGGGAGAGVGKPNFQPLVVELDLESGMTGLLKLIASGKSIPSIELEGVAADGKTVYDLKLGDVKVTTFHDSSTGKDMLSFDYSQVSLTTTPQNDDGSAGKPETFTWNEATNTANVKIPDPKPAAGPTGGDAENFFLTIDGIAGDSKADGHKGAFEIDGYTFDVGALVNAIGHAGGAGAGKPNFQPLTVELDLDAGMTGLLKLIASGKTIPSIELEGVSADGKTVYDLTLGNVKVTAFHDSSTGKDMVSFDYGQVSLTTIPQKDDGSLGSPSKFEWNVAANNSTVKIPEPTVPANAVASADAQNFFLTIDGVAGDSTHKDHKGAFEIDGYTFDVTALVNAIGHGGGAGSGKTTFQPLTVELDMDSGMAALLKSIATGKTIPSIELEGVGADGKTVYDLTLGNVKVTAFHDSATGKDMVSFDYTQVSLTTTGQTDDGSLAKPETFTWNVATNTPTVNITEPKPAAGQGSVGAENFFLTIDGVAGDSNADGHKGAFEIDNFTFDVTALLSTGFGGGAGSGKPTFHPLTVELDLESGMTGLLKLMATGKHIPSIELEGVSADGKTVYDLKLGDVTVTTFHDSSTGKDMVTFDYKQVSLTTTGQQADGSISKPETFSWNEATNSANVNIPDPKVPAGGPTGGDAQNFFLTIDGIAGESTDKDHKGAFEIDGYTFDVSALMNATGYGGGASSGKPTFQPLTVELDLDSGMAALLKGMANGKTIPSIELEGVAADGETVYDLKLGDVTVTTFHDDATGKDMLSFSYKQVSLTTTPQDDDGSLGKPSTFEWNLATNTSNVKISDPNVPADAAHLNGATNGHASAVLIGGPGQILTGSEMSHDTFVFAGNFGSNEITNFHHHEDQILLEKSHFGSAENVLQQHAAEDGHGNTIITDPQNPQNVIVLDHVSLGDLDVTDFMML